MSKDAFSGFHPLVNFAYFAAVLLTTMFALQPVYLWLTLVCGCCYLFYLQGKKGFRRQVGYLLPMLIAMAVMNPMFNHQGITVLFFLPNDNPVTLEAVLFGLSSAAMMGASIVWFNCLNTVFTSDKIIYLFGRLVPALSLLISMTLRFVPRFKTYLLTTLQVQQGLHRPETPREKLSQALSAFSATVSWAMEQSIVCADSMKSRGYGTRGRTAFSIYIFEKRDGAALAAIFLLLAGALGPWFAGWTSWAFYPALTGALWGPGQVFAYLCCGGLFALPLIIDLTEDHKWNSLRSGI